MSLTSMCVSIVAKVLRGDQIYSDTKWSTESFGDFPVRTVTRFLQTLATYNDTLEHLTLEQDVMHARNVGKPLPHLQD